MMLQNWQSCVDVAFPLTLSSCRFLGFPCGYQEETQGPFCGSTFLQLKGLLWCVRDGCTCSLPCLQSCCHSSMGSCVCCWLLFPRPAATRPTCCQVLTRPWRRPGQQWVPGVLSGGCSGENVCAVLHGMRKCPGVQRIKASFTPEDAFSWSFPGALQLLLFPHPAG